MGDGRRATPWTWLLAALLVVAAIVYTRGLGDYQIDDDEEGYAYAAWRVSEGDLPYRDFLTPQLPGFLYTGAAVVGASGRSLEALRLASVVATLAAATFIFVAARSLLGSGGGALLAAATFLVIEDVFGVGRAFRPESFMLAATTAALALVAVAEARQERRDRRLGYMAASLCFGVGMLAKLFAALPWAAAVAYVAAEVLLRRRSVREAASDMIALTLPGVALVSAVMGGFLVSEPATYAAVFGHHLSQGADLGWTAIAGNTLRFFRSAAERHAVLLAFVPAGIAGLRAVAGPRGWLVAWQFPTVLAFFLLSRDLFHRHLVVFMPALALCFAAAVVWFAEAAGVDRPGPARRLGRFVVTSILIAFLVPLGHDVYEGYRGKELGTAAITSVTRALTSAGDLVVADTPGPAFHAGRSTTYSAAGLSAGAAQSGQITGEQLLGQMSDTTTLVLVDSSPARGHLGQLRDFAAFREALERNYDLLGHTVRAHLRYDVFRARSQPSVGFAGPYEVLGVSAPMRADAGRAMHLDVAWRVAPPEVRDPEGGGDTFEVQLATGDQAQVAVTEVPAADPQGRGRATLAAPDEVLAKPIELLVPSGTPSGTYLLRLRAAGPGGTGAWLPLGEIQIGLDERPSLAWAPLTPRPARADIIRP